MSVMIMSESCILVVVYVYMFCFCRHEETVVQLFYGHSSQLWIVAWSGRHQKCYSSIAGSGMTTILFLINIMTTT